MTHIRVKKDKKNMNQNQVKLIAIDMDGTLLNSQKEIPKENIKAIQEARLQQVLKSYYVQVAHVQALFPILKNWVLVKKSSLS